MTVLQDASLSHLDFQITGVFPRQKEGGALVRFSHGPDVTPNQVEEAIQAYLHSEPPAAPWPPKSFYSMKVDLVEGHPAAQDGESSLSPSTRLRVAFLSSPGLRPTQPLSRTQLHALFQPFGELTNVSVKSKEDGDHEDGARAASVEYTQLRRAVAAKNCRDGMQVSVDPSSGQKVILKIEYEQGQRLAWVRDLLRSSNAEASSGLLGEAGGLASSLVKALVGIPPLSFGSSSGGSSSGGSGSGSSSSRSKWSAFFLNPRFLIPIIVAGFTTGSLLVFDPIRTFCIKSHTKHASTFAAIIDSRAGRSAARLVRSNNV